MKFKNYGFKLVYQGLTACKYEAKADNETLKELISKFFI